MTKLQKILCPTDYSDLSVGAVNYAVLLAEKFSAKLHLLHVVDQAYQYWMAMGPETVPTGPSIEEMTETAKKQMGEFISQHVPEKLGATTEIVSGRPFMEIIHIAREREIDLIVIGTHGRGALTQMLLGSVAEKVIRKAPCPVLSVRQPGHEFTMP